MEQHDLLIGQEDAALLDKCLERFGEDTGVRTAVLMGRDGHIVSTFGQNKSADVQSLSALAVGAFASSEALAHLTGEDSFNSIFHQGVRGNVYISLVGSSHLLLALFDYNASAPLVRLQARVAAESALGVLERAFQRTSAARLDARGM